MHLLLFHLVDDAKNYGSLSEHSMFTFESCFGRLKRKLNGTTGLAEQFIESKLP